MTDMKKRLYDILERPEGHASQAGYWINAFLVGLILINVVAVILETVNSIYSQYIKLFRWFETVSIIIFSIEYLLRLWVCTVNSKYSQPFFGRLKYALSFFAIIDLAVILPFYLPLLLPFDLRLLRILRVFRMFRIMKLARYMKSLHFLLGVIRAKKNELYVTFSFLVVMLLLASTLIYYIEHNAQPDKFASIPESMWWGVVTLTTVGYGDIYPITPLGKFISATIAVLGIGLFALPAGIITSGIIEAMHKSKISKCPHCGREI